MKRLWLWHVVLDRWLLISLCLVIGVRLLQCVAGGLFADSGICVDFSQVNDVGIALFAFIPLFLLSFAGSLGLIQKEPLLVRFGTREGFVYWFVLVLLAKACIFAIAISASAFLVVYLQYSGNIADGSGWSEGAAASTALMICFFLTCALILLAAYLWSGREQFAVLVVLAYAFFDYLVDHIPGLSGAFPAVGWHLTEVSRGLDLVDFSFRALLLLTLGAVAFVLGLLGIRSRDFFGVGDERDV